MTYNGLFTSAMEFLAKQALPFRGHRDHNVDFSNDDINHGNFVAIIQLMAKENSVLQKHLSCAKYHCMYIIE